VSDEHLALLHSRKDVDRLAGLDWRRIDDGQRDLDLRPGGLELIRAQEIAGLERKGEAGSRGHRPHRLAVEITGGDSKGYHVDVGRRVDVAELHRGPQSEHADGLTTAHNLGADDDAEDGDDHHAEEDCRDQPAPVHTIPLSQLRKSDGTERRRGTASPIISPASARPR